LPFYHTNYTFTKYDILFEKWYDLLKNTGLFRVNKSIEIDENLLATVIAKYCQITIIFSYS